jgi:hypothetical protein
MRSLLKIPLFFSRQAGAMRRLLAAWLLVAGWAVSAALASGMGARRMAELRAQTGAMFYHGFESYMRHAFPEDEVRKR